MKNLQLTFIFILSILTTASTQSELILSNCNDLIIDMYVWDNENNVDYCSVALSVIPEPTVDCYPYLEVNGFVKTEDDKPIQDAEVFLNCNLPEYPQSTFTDANGYYSFGNVHDNSAGCYISVDKDDDFNTSVTTLDLVKIMRHILGIQSFTTPYQLLASDVSGSQSIKASDLLLLRKLILGVISEFPDVDPWIFLDDSFQFVDPDNPWDDFVVIDVDPYKITINQNSQAPYNFVGVKIGNIVD